MKTPVTVLMAEDDPDDRLFMEEAFRNTSCRALLKFVENGEELMDFLHRRGRYEDPRLSPKPDLILLDLNMPRKDGREALREIKGDPGLRSIPVIVWTTSSLEEDMAICSHAGADGYFTKPSAYADMTESVRRICEAWIGGD